MKGLHAFRLRLSAGLAAAAIAGLVLAGCGGSDEDDPAAAPTSAPAAAPASGSAPSAAPTAAPSGSAPSAAPTAAPSGSAPSAPSAPAATGEKPQYGGEYRFQTTSPRIGQDPKNTTGTGYFYNWGRALSSLLRYKLGPDIPAGSYIVIPDLAQSWENPSPTEYILHLNPDAKWHDAAPAPRVAGLNGRAFTADDAVFSINRLMEEGSAQRGYWASVEGAEALDESTVKVTLKAPSAEFLSNVAFGFNKMMAPEAVAAGGGNLQQGPNMGTGGWIVECEVDVQCVYHRNPDYHLKDEAGNATPYLDRLRNVIMPDVQARFAAFRAKKLDVHGPTTEQRIILDRNYPEVEIDEYKSYGSTFIHFRTDQAPWSDKRVRQAVSKAIDRREIWDTIYDGRGHMSMAMAMPSDSAYLPQEEFKAAWTRDLAGAKELLAEAGFPNGIDAKLWVANYSETYIALVELIQQQIKEAGIRVELFIHDRPVYLSRVFTRHGEFEDMAYGPQGIFTADQWLNAYYHSDGGRNSSWVDDPALDKMIEDQSSELDTKKRAELLVEIQRYLLDQTYQAVIYSAESQIAYWPWIRDRSTSAGVDYPGARREETWWLDQAIYEEFN